MVKILILLSLLAIVSATTPHGLSEIANVATQVIIDAGVYADTSTGPTLLTLTYPTTYDCSVTNPSVFTIAGTATYAGNNTVAGGAITFTSGTNSVVIPFEATVTGLTTATLGTDAYPVFRVGGTYTATVQLFTSTLHVYPVTLVTGNLATVAVTAYAGPALSALSIVSPQNGGCDNLGCTLPINGSATLNPGRVSTQLKVYFRSPAAATAVKFQITSSVTGAGASDFNTQSNPIYAVLGGIQDGAFVANSQTAATSTVIPQGLPLAISGQAQESGYRFTYFNEATVGALQASVTFTGGSTDVTAPTCSVATVSPLTLSTNVPALYPLTITLTCADEQGGSGLWTKGYIAVAKVSSNGATTTPPFVQTFSTATSTFYVPPYVSGSFNIIGVFAIDNAGNGALYGDCGGAVGYDTLCAGISSASTMTISLFSVVVLAFFVLCA